MMIKKAVILVGGLGTRFLPLTKTTPKEMLPLVDKPIIHYVLEEVVEAGIEEVIFVLSPRNRMVLDYVEERPELRSLLKRRGQLKRVEQLDIVSNLVDGLKISSVVQENPLGNGHALLQARREVGDEPFVLIFSDDVFWGKELPLEQLIDVYKGAKKPILGLVEVEKGEVESYGVVEKEDLARNLYRVKGCVEKPKKEEAPSRLAMVGRYILEPNIFSFLEETEVQDDEIFLTNAFPLALKAGKSIYGTRIKSRWLKCGSKKGWLEANIFLSQNDPRFNL